MTRVELVGTVLLAFGSPLVMFLMTVSKDPIRIILFVMASFIWLLSFIASSTVWMILNAIGAHISIAVIITIGIQELCRFLLYRVILATESALKLLNPDICPTEQELFIPRMIFSYVIGLGYGVMSGLFQSVNLMAVVAGPGSIGLQGDSQYFLLSSALLTLCIVLLNVCWTIIMMSAIIRGERVPIIYTVLTHVLFSVCTIFDYDQMYWFTLIIPLLLVPVSALAAFKMAGGSLPPKQGDDEAVDL